MDDAQLDALIERIEVDEETGDVVLPVELLEAMHIDPKYPPRVIADELTSVIQQVIERENSE